MDTEESVYSIEESGTNPVRFSFLKKVLDWVITIALAGIAVYCLGGGNYGSGEEIYLFGYKPVVILSGSMEPYLKTDSIVLVKKTQDIQENDVIMFSPDGKSKVCHRAVAIDEQGYITTKGDSNEQEDFQKVFIKDVEGKVTGRMNFLVPLVKLIRRGTSM